MRYFNDYIFEDLLDNIDLNDDNSVISNISNDNVVDINQFLYVLSIGCNISVSRIIDLMVVFYKLKEKFNVFLDSYYTDNVFYCSKDFISPIELKEKIHTEIERRISNILEHLITIDDNNRIKRLELYDKELDVKPLTNDLMKRCDDLGKVYYYVYFNFDRNLYHIFNFLCELSKLSDVIHCSITFGKTSITSIPTWLYSPKCIWQDDINKYTKKFSNVIYTLFYRNAPDKIGNYIFDDIEKEDKEAFDYIIKVAKKVAIK